MSFNQRRIYLLFFVLLFAIIAPTIILMSQGYRFDRIGKIFVHSGSVTVKINPRDAKIFLDGKEQKLGKLSVINDSYTINGIRPGNYSLRCEKDGYTSWEKNVNVHSGVSTEFWNVTLFPNNLADFLQSYPAGTMDQFFLSPRNNDEVIYFIHENDQNKVYLLNVKNNEKEEIFSTDKLRFPDPSEEENVEWSTDNKRILIPFYDENEQKTYIAARIKKEVLLEPANLLEIINGHKDKSENSISILENKNLAEEKIRLKKVRWMFEKNDEFVALSEDHKLYYFNLSEPENKTVIDENVSGFDFAGNHIYYSQLPNNIVWEIKNNDISTKKQITSKTIPSKEDDFDSRDFIKLFVYDEYRIGILNASQDLYLFNREKEKNEVFHDLIGSNIQGLQFSNDGKKMLYWSNNEIKFYMMREWEVQPQRKKGENHLITRFSQPIKNIQWMDNFENVIFSVGDEIKSVEIDLRDHPNIINITKKIKPIDEREMFYNKNNQTLFLKNKATNEQYFLETIILIEKTNILGL